MHLKTPFAFMVQLWPVGTWAYKTCLHSYCI